MGESQPAASDETGSLTPVDVVDVRHPRSHSNVLVVACLICLVTIFLTAEVVVPKNKQTGRWSLPLNYGIWIFAATMSYLFRYLPIIRIDAHGVAAHRRQFDIRATLVPWDEILSWDFVEVRSRWNEASGTIPVFKDSAGNVLLTYKPPAGVNISVEVLLQSSKCCFWISELWLCPVSRTAGKLGAGESRSNCTPV